MRHRLSIFLTLSSLLLTPVADAQESPLALTFRDALARARDQPPSVLAALAGVSLARAEASYARGARLPRVTMEGASMLTYSQAPEVAVDDVQNNLTYRTRRVDGRTREQRGSLTLELAVIDLARRRSVQTADRNVEVQQQARAETVRDALELAARLYLGAVATRDLIADAQLSFERRTSQHAAIRSLVRAGLHPAVDAARAEIEVVAARYALEARQVENEAALAALAAAIGFDPAQPVRPTDFDDASLPTPLAPEQAADRARATSPEALRSTATRELRDAEHRGALAARLPTLGVQGSGEASHLGVVRGMALEGARFGASAGVVMRWAGLDPATWRRAQVTRAALAQAERQRDATLLSVRAQSTEAAFEVQRTHAVLGQAMEVWNAAQTARNAQNARYKEGVATLLELLDAEGVEQAARRQRIEAVRDHRVARMRLLAVSGTLDALAK